MSRQVDEYFQILAALLSAAPNKEMQIPMTALASRDSAIITWWYDPGTGSYRIRLTESPVVVIESSREIEGN